MKSAEGFVADFIRHFSRDWLQESIAARDAEWQARVDRLTAALKQYANRDNWELDEEHNTFRRWLEPDSYTPYAYNGFSIARAALAESEAAHG